MTPDLKRLCEAAKLHKLGPGAHDPDVVSEAIVRAVLAELREPSEGMAKAGRSRLRRYHRNDEPDVLDTNSMAFTAMIDHILAEPATA